MRPIHVIESVASHGRVVIWKPFDVNTQIGAEIVIDVCCATVAEVRKRGENFWGEFEFYLSDLAVGMVLDIVLVTLLAPVAVIGKYPKAVQSTGLPPSQPHVNLSFDAFQYADRLGAPVCPAMICAVMATLDIACYCHPSGACGSEAVNSTGLPSPGWTSSKYIFCTYGRGRSSGCQSIEFLLQSAHTTILSFKVLTLLTLSSKFTG